jgi:hypothetical protein
MSIILRPAIDYVNYGVTPQPGYPATLFDKIGEETYDEEITNLFNITTGDQFAYFMMDSFTTSLQINNLVVHVRAKGSSGTTLQIILDVNSNLFYSDFNNLSSNYAMYSFEWPLNPDSSDPWTYEAVNFIKVGYACYGQGAGDYSYVTQMYAEVKVINGKFTPRKIFVNSASFWYVDNNKELRSVGTSCINMLRPSSDWLISSGISPHPSDPGTCFDKVNGVEIPIDDFNTYIHAMSSAFDKYAVFGLDSYSSILPIESITVTIIALGSHQLITPYILYDSVSYDGFGQNLNFDVITTVSHTWYVNPVTKLRWTKDDLLLFKAGVHIHPSLDISEYKIGYISVTIQHVPYDLYMYAESSGYYAIIGKTDIFNTSLNVSTSTSSSINLIGSNVY